ncbi:helix-turn-helix domain-containing protein [Mycoplasmopsis arginini]|uniref:helix-turn-helix domain-containing protein n=3 Tax=Bacillati TaxID=1783272 RepID=UPI0005C2702F|nr:helix-turn-helix domain-containing protein [Mycoplasmopsis arginini]MDI3348526.1 helix-turn-helix domain-containing protein [Mycoplasmopsis arginini]MDI3348983.1 helix-turn-helix domain-containing protein [Mycoplasmopsis arginini]BAQ54269.1 transposase [Mycoplasmopsis arginini]BAQ54505.1 transposase [Mycoplasmopsis arginini]BAQ54630.1 transposase [Mycoplasmopsis arginini]
MKLKLEDKINIIKLLEENETKKNIMNLYNISKSRLNTIYSLYKIHGYQGLVRKHNNKYSYDFKIQIIKEIKNGEPMNKIANKLNVNVGLIYSWFKKYSNLDYNGLNRKQGRPRKMKFEYQKKDKNDLCEMQIKIKELEERNSQLEMENDLLKKLRALVLQRKQQQRKKK